MCLSFYDALNVLHSCCWFIFAFLAVHLRTLSTLVRTWPGPLTCYDSLTGYKFQALPNLQPIAAPHWGVFSLPAEVHHRSVLSVLSLNIFRYPSISGTMVCCLNVCKCCRGAGRREVTWNGMKWARRKWTINKGNETAAMDSIVWNVLIMTKSKLLSFS